MLLTVAQALAIIQNNHRVAVVGLSQKEDRPSFRVAKFLLEKGFTVVPVNPSQQQILGRTCVAALKDLNPGDVDWIDFFVGPNRLPGFAEDVVRLSPKLVWCQIGVVNEAFNRTLANAGIPYIADVCPKIEWKEELP